jgi:hypothetical protein
LFGADSLIALEKSSNCQDCASELHQGFRSVFRRFLAVGKGATVIVCVNPSRTSSNRQTWQR